MEELTQKQEVQKEEILKALTDWQDQPIETLGVFSALFSKYKGFQFVCDHVGKTNVYFGLILNKQGQPEPVAYVIPQEKDDSPSAYDNVQVSFVTKDVGFELISEKKAHARIKRWEKDGKSWMEENQGNLFKAVSIPAHDFKKEKNKLLFAFFALKKVYKKEEGKKVFKGLGFDLILESPSGDVYMDTVHLIPPLKPGDTAYILSQIPPEIIG